MDWMKVGLVCGAGPLAGADLYCKLVVECNLAGASLDEEYPEIVLYNYPYFGVDEKGGVGDSTRQALETSLHFLEEQGVQVFGLGCNSIHALVPVTRMKFVSMPQAVSAQLTSRQKKVGLLATKQTIESGIYQNALMPRGIELVLPTPSQQAIIDECISFVLQFNYAKAKIKLERLNEELLETTDCNILACSELPLAKPELGKTIDCNQALAAALVKAALKSK